MNYDIELSLSGLEVRRSRCGVPQSKRYKLLRRKTLLQFLEKHETKDAAIVIEFEQSERTYVVVLMISGSDGV
jgi:hypothetical protein